MEITDTQLDDAEELLRQHQSCCRRTFFQSIVEDNQRDLSFETAIINHIHFGEYIGLVARCNNQIVGSIYLIGGKLIRTYVVELEMKVTKAYRGLGIGKRLLKIAIYRARQRRHISKIKLSVIDNNQSAIQLYQKLGFEEEGVLRNELREVTGEYRNVICMGLMV